MGSRAMVVLRAIPILTPPKLLLLHRSFSYGVGAAKRINRQCYSTNSGNGSSLQAPDVSSLAQTARISLTPEEVEEFGPKINQVIDWFGQLQAVDLESIDPAIRAETEGDNIREDIPEEFANREAMIASIPSYNEPYIKVPKILNKE